MGMNRRLQRSRARARRPCAGAQGQTARAQAGCNRESDFGETPIRGNAPGRPPHTGVKQGSPQHRTGAEMLIVEYNRAACAATPTVRGAAPKAIKPRVRANWVSMDHISPILSNWLIQITPPNPDMSINADMSITH